MAVVAAGMHPAPKPQHGRLGSASGARDCCRLRDVRKPRGGENTKSEPFRGGCYPCGDVALLCLDKAGVGVLPSGTLRSPSLGAPLLVLVAP